MSNGYTPRRSIFSGLLLILIGALFLVHYMAPGLIDLERVARYWPVLLILWGLAKIFDHFAAQRVGEATPRPLTGGEFILLIVVIGFGAAVLTSQWIHHKHPELNISLDLFEQPYTFNSELPAQPVKADSQIMIVTPRGNITVRPEDTPDLRVVVAKTANAGSERAAEDLANKVSVAVEKVAGGFQIEPHIPDEASGVQVNLEVHLPRQASVTAKTDRGKIEAADLAGAFSAASGHGDLEIHNAGASISADIRHGDARITGVHGDVHLTGSGGEIELDDVTGAASIEGEFYGPIRIRNVAKSVHFLSKKTDLTIGTLPGRLEVDAGKLVASDTPGSVSLTTKNRDIELDNVSGRIQIANRHGDIEVRFSEPPREEVNIANESGSVDLVLPTKSNCEIAALSHSGDVECDFQTPTLKLVHQSDDSRLDGQLGTHGPQFHVTTSYGTIHIRKAD